MNKDDFIRACLTEVGYEYLCDFIFDEPTLDEIAAEKKADDLWNITNAGK